MHLKLISMKKYLPAIFRLIPVFLLSFSVITQAQYSSPDEESQNRSGNCTSIMIGRLATTDGSVITSHTCDGTYRTWLEIFQRNL
jgi:hypothetical protein